MHFGFVKGWAAGAGFAKFADEGHGFEVGLKAGRIDMHWFN
ncbi:MAG: hypothetical protein WKF91_21425 [Segetibacter sp.]